jgi:hypothetical protein
MATNQAKNKKRPSIEEKICNMLEKILDESNDEDEELDKMTALTTVDNSSIAFTTLDTNNYQRTEKKTQSQKQTKVQIYFNYPPEDEMNYEQMYSHQKTLLHRQKKFKTTAFRSANMINIGDSNNYPGYSFNNSLSTSKSSIKSLPRCNSSIGYQNVFSFNEGEGVERLLNDKNDEITSELYDQLKGHFCYLIKTQNGSRILQNCLIKTDSKILSLVCQEILPDLHNFMIDCYGNYFCQKFYNHVTHEERLMILKQLKKHLVQVANNSVGTYPLQTIIENATNPEERVIICEAIANDKVLKDICSDQQGVHVIEKIIVCFKEEFISFIYEYVLRNFLALAYTSTGLVIVKKIIIHTTQPHTLRCLQILLVNNFNELIQNAFGNYTIQVALDVKIP